MSAYKKISIEKEYNTSASNLEEFEKVKWGSHEKMYNRFKLAMNVINFNNVHDWLDVGSGTGAFQTVVTRQYPKVKATGIDMSSELVKFASTREDVNHGSVKFYTRDFLDYNGDTFDLITCIGVLQKTNISTKQFFELAHKSLKTGGKIFLDTKNCNWVRFKEPDFFPEDTHSWFDANELIKEATETGFENIAVKGFVPGENKVVAPNDSHTIFLIAQKLA